MKHCIAKVGLGIAGAGLLCSFMAAAVVTGGAVAQDRDSVRTDGGRRVGPPIRLVPGEDDAARDQESRPDSARRRREETRVDRRSGARRDRQAVRREELGPPSLENYGTLPVEEGGFGVDMWGGADRGLLERLIPRLPDRSPVPRIRQLTRRLLLTPAQVPGRAGDGTDLLSARAERLIAMGRAGDAAALLAPATGEQSTPERARLRIEAHMLAGDHESACETVRARLESQASAYLDRAMVVCHVLSGNHDRAEVGISLMREQGNTPSEVFEMLVAANRPGASAELPSLDRPDAFSTALLLNAGLPLPADFIAAGHPAYLSAAARPEGGGPPTRHIAAAEQAATYGALPTDRLGDLYRGLPLRTAWRAAASRITLARYDTLRRAILYQAAEARTTGAARLAVLRHWWRLAEASEERGHAFMIARLTAPLAESVNRDPDLTAYAADAGRAAFRAGDGQRAFGWYQLLANSRVRDQGALARLALLARLSGRPAVFGPRELGAWRTAMREAYGPAGAESRALYLYALMDGLGEAQAQRDMWSRSLPEGASTRIARGAAPDLARLRDAVRRGGKGPALLILLAEIGNRSLAELEPATLRLMLVSLREIDLGTEARRLAVEAALDRGL